MERVVERVLIYFAFSNINDVQFLILHHLFNTHEFHC